MPDSLTLDVNADEVTATLRSLPAALKPFIKGASKISAEHIRDDAKARLLRQLSGTSTGETVAGIVVKADRSGWGAIVDAGNLTTPMLDRWLEYSTKKMRARPFFWDSVRLEESAHRSRIRSAIMAGCHEHGFTVTT
jgi:hypothetical protein